MIASSTPSSPSRAWARSSCGNGSGVTRPSSPTPVPPLAVAPGPRPAGTCSGHLLRLWTTTHGPGPGTEAQSSAWIRGRLSCASPWPRRTPRDLVGPGAGRHHPGAAGRTTGRRSGRGAGRGSLGLVDGRGRHRPAPPCWVAPPLVDGCRLRPAGTPSPGPPPGHGRPGPAAVSDRRVRAARGRRAQGRVPASDRIGPHPAWVATRRTTWCWTTSTSRAATSSSSCRAAPAAVSVRDLLSSNGSQVLTPGTGGRRGRPGSRAGRGDVVQVGSHRIALRPEPGGRPARGRVSATWSSTEPPTRPPSRPSNRDHGPCPADATPGDAPSWPMVALPLLFAVPAAWWWHQPMLLLMGLLSPATAVAQFVSDRRRGRREHRRAETAYRAALGDADDNLREALRQAARHAWERHPDPAVVAEVAARRDQRLWRRGGDGPLSVRVGTADQNAPVVRRSPEGPEPATLVDAPLTLDLAESAVLGICGPVGPARALARCLVGQAAVWCSPADLEITVLTATPGAADRPGWGWTAWLPHASSFAPAAGPGSRRPPAAAGTWWCSTALARPPRADVAAEPPRPHSPDLSGRPPGRSCHGSAEPVLTRRRPPARRAGRPCRAAASSSAARSSATRAAARPGLPTRAARPVLGLAAGPRPGAVARRRATGTGTGLPDQVRLLDLVTARPTPRPSHGAGWRPGPERSGSPAG